MESPEYDLMYQLETDYWWFRAMHEAILDTLRGRIQPDDAVLDAGCGTGGLMARLRELTPHVYGLDISRDAAAFWHQRGISGRACRASINQLPYPEASFGAVVSVDILECDGVRDGLAYSELVRVARPGGWVVTVVPAYQWMMTAGHHQAVHAVRRYNKRSYQALADATTVDVHRLTHYYAALFPMIGGVRLLNRLQEQFGSVEVKSELSPLPTWLNETLYRITTLERHLLRRVDLPFGSSLLMVARKAPVS